MAEPRKVTLLDISNSKYENRGLGKKGKQTKQQQILVRERKNNKNFRITGMQRKEGLKISVLRPKQVIFEIQKLSSDHTQVDIAIIQTIRPNLYKQISPLGTTPSKQVADFSAFSYPFHIEDISFADVVSPFYALFCIGREDKDGN